MGQRIYADYAATTPLCGEALSAMQEALSSLYGNPSSPYEEGRAAKRRLEEARHRMAVCLGARPDELFFTSGGSEADNWALRGMAAVCRRLGKRRIVSSAIEHHAVLRTLNALEQEGFEVELLAPFADGRIRMEQVEAALGSDTGLCSLMYANNETGVLQPVEEVGALCRKRGIFFHTDAVQAVGHVPFDLAQQPFDLFSCSAHKFGGPKGVGALYIRRGLRPEPLISGGGQERGQRAGTENVPGILGMAAALEASCGCMEAEAARIGRLRDLLIRQVQAALPEAVVFGAEQERLPGHAAFGFPGLSGELLVTMMDQEGVSVSAGAACSSGAAEPSHVLRAMGIEDALSASLLRVSLGKESGEAQILQLADTLIAAVRRLKTL